MFTTCQSVRHHLRPPSIYPHLPLFQSSHKHHQSPHKSCVCVCVSPHVPTPAPSPGGRIMICSRGVHYISRWCTYSSVGESGGYFSASFAALVWAVYPCIQFSPLNWPIPTSFTLLHKPTRNLSHWLAGWLFSHARQKAQQRVHTCTYRRGRRHHRICYERVTFPLLPLRQAVRRRRT